MRKELGALFLLILPRNPRRTEADVRHRYVAIRQRAARACGNVVGVAILLAIVSPAIAGPRAEALSHCKAIQDVVQRRDCFRSLNGKIQAAPPVPFVQNRGADNLPTTSAINHLNAAVGRPLCVDRDALAAMLMAGVLASSPEHVTTNGCQTISEDAEVEVLERYPSSFRFLRVVKAKVTTPSVSAPLVGYTIEVAP